MLWAWRRAVELNRDLITVNFPVDRETDFAKVEIGYPNEGEIRIRGRVASLLEIGTGFHPELSGRDNIYLNGAILGMSRAETTRKMKESVEFSEIEQFIDTPVKRYSSGMYVKLAFAVAAHLDPDILIALGIHHQLRYPLYYIKKLGLSCTPSQREQLEARRRVVEAELASLPPFVRLLRDTLTHIARRKGDLSPC